MSLMNRLVKLEARRKRLGTAPCSDCHRRRNPHNNDEATRLKAQWQSIYQDVYEDRIVASDAAASADCSRCGRCALGFADCAQAYFLANQEAS